MKKFIFILLLGLFFVGCGGGGGSGSDTNTNTSYVTNDLSNTSVWSVKGKYDYCSEYATGNFEFISENGIIVKAVYTGEDWHHDCTISNIGTITYDISSLNLSESLDKSEIEKLIQYLYVHDTGSNYERWDVDANQIGVDDYSINVHDTSDGSLEIIEMQKQNDSTNSTTSSYADYVGNYKGTYSGDDQGTWEFTINDDGIISGYAYSSVYGTLPLYGNVESDGTTAFGNSSYGVIYQGKIDSEGKISGTWYNNNGYSGTFSGQKQ